MVDGHTDYLQGLFILVERRREKIKNTAARDMSDERQWRNVTEVTATKKAAER